MSKVLVTGGCGYIGSHTIVELLTNNFEVICVDGPKANTLVLDGIKEITGKEVKLYKIDLTNYLETKQLFEKEKDIYAVIHFAALKSVSGSVLQPALYYQNNLFSLINILRNMEELEIKNLVFSSSATVYGAGNPMPVDESMPFGVATNPYGHTKQLGEEIIRGESQFKNISAAFLRYFNPVGAHPSLRIGETPVGKPANLVPLLTLFASGKLDSFSVAGNDYPTKDGSCIRDYVHVSDVARAHVASLNYLDKQQNGCEAFNIGTGNGVTVFELISTLEKILGHTLSYSIGERRAGDIAENYANVQKAKDILQWESIYSLEDMMQTAWAWQIKLNNRLK